MRRMKEREKEREADARDRQREKEELEEIKRRLMEEGHPDPEAELAKVRKYIWEFVNCRQDQMHQW